MRHTIRYLLKNKSYAIINLIGLTIGLAACIFIVLFVQDELSYDKYIPGYDRVVRIQPSISTGNDEQQWATAEGFLIPTLSSMYPEIESATRIFRNDNEIVIKTDSIQFAQDGIVAVDSSFFQVFPLEFIYGNRATAFQKPDGVVITRAIAHKYFGNQDPVGKMISTDFATFTVTGVIDDIPHSSHFTFKLLFSLTYWWDGADQSRNMYAFYSYIRLKSADGVEPFIAKTLKDWYAIYGYAKDKDQPAVAADTRVRLTGMPVSDIHLQSRAEKEFRPNGSLQLVYIFIGAAILILLIATINYINLSNAMAIKRSREVAIKKTIGASRLRLFINFILESYVLSFLAFGLSFLTVILLIPSFNTLTGKEFNLQVLLEYKFIFAVLALWILLGFLAGFYPALILSSFNPIQALKSGVGSSKTSKFSLYLRRGLIISQFTISALLIVGSFTIDRQLKFIMNKDVGFNKSNVIVLPLISEARQNAEALKHELAKIKSVEAISASSVVPGKRIVILNVRIPDLAGTQVDTEGKADDGVREMRVMGADHDIVKTLGLQIVEGRDFSINNAADTEQAFLLNEAAVKHFGLKDPVGRPFEYLFRREPKKGNIIGIVKDFNFASIHSAVEPLMIHIYPPFCSNLCVRLNTISEHNAVDEIERAWKSVTAAPFSYQFLDSTYDAMYRAEKTTGSVIRYFTGIAIIIAALGLFGIVSFFTTQRIREVGIRKVFGASQPTLVKVLSVEYLAMVIIGNIVALYPAWILIDGWLQQFAYRVDISVSSFIITLVASEVIAFASIVYVVLKAAMVNPVRILRYE